MPLTDVGETARYVRALAATSRLLQDLAKDERVYIPQEVAQELAQQIDKIYREVNSGNN